jgi:ubiquinone/menaquinone biosynthesis C-methylase UbiE
MTVKKFFKKLLTSSPRLYSLLLSSFDAYQRFKLVSELVKETDSEKILDIGGDIGHLRYFLPGRSITTADVSGKADYKIKNSKTFGLPFKEKEFDCSVTIDTFQYVKKSQRKEFINEMLRVSKNYVIIAAPFDSLEVVSAEKECNAFYKRIFNKDFHWFALTLKSGFPELKEVEQILKEKKKKYSVFSNGYLKRWKIMIKINTWLYRFLFPFAIFINGIYNILFYRYDNKEPSYRKVIFVKLK